MINSNHMAGQKKKTWMRHPIYFYGLYEDGPELKMKKFYNLVVLPFINPLINELKSSVVTEMGTENGVSGTAYLLNKQHCYNHISKSGNFFNP